MSVLKEWAEVDSNHRSNLQQIYSLSPLATRESIHVVLADIIYTINPPKLQAIFRKIEKITTEGTQFMGKVLRPIPLSPVWISPA